VSTVYIECPKKPAASMYDLLGLIRPHADFSPAKPDDGAGEIAWRNYRALLVREADMHTRQKETLIKPSTAPLFICGEGIEPEPFCRCGHTAEMLCDHPMGGGGTCDLPLCWCCSRHVGQDLDLCMIHFAAFMKATGVERINPWPPPRRGRP